MHLSQIHFINSQLLFVICCYFRFALDFYNQGLKCFLGTFSDLYLSDSPASVKIVSIRQYKTHVLAASWCEMTLI